MTDFDIEVSRRLAQAVREYDERVWTLMLGEGLTYDEAIKRASSQDA